MLTKKINLIKAYILFIIICLLPGFVFARSILVKLAESPALAKGASVLTTTGSAAVDAVLADYGAQKISPVFPDVYYKGHASFLSQWIVVDFPEQIETGKIISSLQTTGVLEVQENHVFPLHFVPNDSLYVEQYALEKIDAESAWDVERGSKDVLVAVIDTGIDYEHPDIADNLWFNAAEDVNGNGQVDASDFNGVDDDDNGFIDDLRGWDFTDAPNYPDGGDYLERDNDPMDEHGHGTGVAGLIAAVTNNEFGIAGLAFNCRVMNLRAFNSSGYGEEDDAASAILYAIVNGAQIVNMSFGDVFVSRLLDDVIKYGYQCGLVMVASSGNSSTDEIHYPSGFAETISVGATDENDQLAGFSNFGPSVDLVAPGSFVLSLDLDGKFHNWSGTSFSAPYVAAAAALLLSNQPGLSPDAVRSILVNSADDLGHPGWDDKFGAGRLNVFRMLRQNQHVIAQISEPRLDGGYSSAPIEIYGSAWSPDFQFYDLHYGHGSNPQDWIAISTNNKQRLFDGLLATWHDIPELEGEYTLKLSVTSADAVATLHTTRLFLDSSDPVVTDVQLLPMLDGDKHSVLVQADVDDLSEGSLFYRLKGGEFQEMPLTFRTTSLRYNLSQNEVEGLLDVWLNVKNGAGLQTIVDNNGSFYDVDLSQPPIDVTSFSPTRLSVPFGRILSKTSDFNQNGLPEMILSISEAGAIGPLTLFEFDGVEMANVFATSKARIPRDVGDSDNDGKLEVLCGFGFNSYIYEAMFPGDFPSNVTKAWEGDGAKQFWASRFADVDGDGKGEIIMRVTRPQDEGASDQFEIFETTGDNTYESVATLPNPTQGENFNGVPHSEVGDFDGDGLLEILLGDSDGDIYIYENIGDDVYAATWQDKLPLLDSIDFLAAGDFDGDGIDEFIAGCHSDPNLNTEHDYDARHWYYRIYDQFANNDYRQVAEWRLFGYESVRDYFSSVSAEDVDDDDRDEIYIAAFPDFYVIDYNDNSYNVVYFYAPVQTSASLVADMNVDGKKEMWVGDETFLTAFEAVGSNTAPATPAGIKAQPLNESTIKITWRLVADAKNYNIYRGTNPERLAVLTTQEKNSFIDSTVVGEKLLYYAVQAVDPNKIPSESRLSQIVQVHPGVNPVFLAAVPETGESLRLRFSAPMNSSVKLPSNYRVNESTRPTSAALDRSGQEVVLTFAQRFAPGDYTMLCENLEDQNGVPLDSTTALKIFSVEPQYPMPYIVDGNMNSDGDIELIFNQPMQKASVENSANYSINSEFIVTAAVLKDSITIHLQAEDLRLKATAGDTLFVQVQNLTSQTGRSTKRGRGDAITLIHPAGGDKDQPFKVYPNPFVSNSGAEAITFANLQEGAQVQILTSRGQLVKTLYKNGSNGDLDWDLKNERGDVVASGIYLYRVTAADFERLDKLAIVR